MLYRNLLGCSISLLTSYVTHRTLRWSLAGSKYTDSTDDMEECNNFSFFFLLFDILRQEKEERTTKKFQISMKLLLFPAKKCMFLGCTYCTVVALGSQRERDCLACLSHTLSCMIRIDARVYMWLLLLYNIRWMK